MAKLTRNGICYDLEKSPYSITKGYSKDLVITYKYSSELYIDKFNEKLEKNRKKFNDSLSNRFGMNIQNNVLCDILLYSKVETRGFYILINEEEYKCLNTIKLIGVNQIEQN